MLETWLKTFKLQKIKFQQWWSQLKLREQQALTMGGCLLGIFIIYQVIWLPWLHHIDSFRERLQNQQQTLAWMQAADKEIKKIVPPANSKNQILTPVALLNLLQKQITKNGLESYLTQLKQASSDTVEMHFKNVSFDKLILLLATVVKSPGITITQMSAVSEDTPGIIAADVMVKVG